MRTVGSYETAKTGRLEPCKDSSPRKYRLDCPRSIQPEYGWRKTMVSEAFALVLEVIHAHGKTIDPVPAVYELEVGPWWCALNPQDEYVDCSRRSLLAPVSVYVEYELEPAAILVPEGGAFRLYGDLGEAQFIEDLKGLLTLLTISK